MRKVWSETWALALFHPSVVKSATATHKQNVAWAEEPLDETLLADVLEVLKPIHNITWLSGRPENNGPWQ